MEEASQILFQLSSNLKLFKIGNYDFINFFKATPNLQNIEYLSFYDFEFIEYIKYLPKMKYLHIEELNIQKIDFECLDHLQDLTYQNHNILLDFDYIKNFLSLIDYEFQIWVMLKSVFKLSEVDNNGKLKNHHFTKDQWLLKNGYCI